MSADRKYVTCEDCKRELSIDDAFFYKGYSFCVDCINDVTMNEDSDQEQCIQFICHNCKQKIEPMELSESDADEEIETKENK